MNLEKLGKFSSNYTKIREIFVDISEKDGNFELMSRVIFAEVIRLPPPSQNFTCYNMFLIFLNINPGSYSFRAVAHENSVKYSDGS